MLTLYEWISLAQWGVMGVTTLLLWRLRTSVKDAVGQADHERRIKGAELEIDRLREWRHKDLVPWQQTLMEKIDERYLTRREFDVSIVEPTERRKRPR